MGKPRLAILVSMVPHNMVDVYQRVGESFETYILISERKISLPFLVQRAVAALSGQLSAFSGQPIEIGASAARTIIQ